MKAIVCDKCGKVVLLPENKPYMYAPAGVYRLASEQDGEVLFEVCEDCGKELLAAVRKMKLSKHGTEGQVKPNG